MENRKRGQGEADGRPVELQAIENWLLQSNLAFVAGAVCVNYNIPLVIFHRPISLCYPLHKHRGPLLRSLLQKIYRRHSFIRYQQFHTVYVSASNVFSHSTLTG